MILGRVDEVDGHFVATKFVAGTIPTECVYVTHNPRVTSSIPIRIEWRSVGLAYARVWFPILAVAIVASQFVLGHLAVLPWLAGSLLLGISVAAHRGGRLPDAEKARLRLLGTVTGLRIDPSKLQHKMRTVKLTSLGDLMVKAGIPTTPSELIDALDDIPLPAIPLVYGFARYSGDDAEWLECANLVYARYEQGEL